MMMTILLTVTFSALVAQASPAPHRTEAIQQRLQEIKDRLDLTNEQTQQVRAVLEEQARRIKTVRDEHGAEQRSRWSRRSMARELRDVRKDMDEQLKRILSKEQMEEMETIREEWRDELRSRRGSGRR